VEIEDKLEKYLLSKKGSYLDFPFGPEAAVYKVGNKMFALGSWREKVP
jgi:predicted DNA-binding protein (MmcQ/YjbR family)